MGWRRTMKMGAAAALWLASSGCSNDDAFQCAKAADCDAGQCEPTGFCSFSDSGCASGRRYGDLAGSLSSQCVPEDESTTQNASGSSDSSGGATGTSTEATTTSASSGITSNTSLGTTDATGGRITTTNAETESTTTSSDSANDSTHDETGATTGPPLDCSAANFGTLPGAPMWFSFSSGGGSAGVSGGKLALQVPATGNALAGLRTATTSGYATSRVTATLDSVPNAAVVTTNLTLGTTTGDSSYAVVFRDGTVRVELFESPDFTVLGSADANDIGWPMTIVVSTEAGQVTTTVEGASQTEVLAQSEMPVWFDDIHASLNAGNPMPVDPMGTVVADFFEICPPL